MKNIKVIFDKKNGVKEEHTFSVSMSFFYKLKTDKSLKESLKDIFLFDLIFHSHIYDFERKNIAIRL